jgi:outer membrane receptor protein involved in Fe transport
MTGIIGTKRNAWLGTTALLTAVAWTPAATSQTAVPGGAAAGSGSSGRDIVVTATKREERLIDVPMSISAISGETLDQQHIQNFADLAARVPGFNIRSDQPGNTRLVLRGLNTGSINSTTAVYVDETAYGSSTSQANGATLTGDLDTYDLQRIEVLRGPQGTLYGASSLGGVVKFVTNAPSMTGFAASGESTIEDVHDGSTAWTSKGMVNVPLSDTTAIRATGFYRRDPGYIDDPMRDAKDVNDGKTYGGRVSLLSNLTPQLSVRLTAAIENLDSNSTPEEDISITTLRPFGGDLTQARAVDPYSDQRYRVYSGTLRWSLPWATLISNTSYGTLRQLRAQDDTGGKTPTTVDSTITTRRFQQEIRLASQPGTRLEWQVGGYYDNERSRLYEQEFQVDALTQDRIGSSEATFDIPSGYQEEAAFTDATYHFNRIFQLTLGGRFSHNTQHSVETVEIPGFPDNGSGPEIHTSDNVFTFSVAPQAHLTKDVTLYARVAKGYRPGGPNLTILGSPALPTFGPDTVINYEAGIKADLLDHHANLEASAFWIDWRNVQIETTVGTINFNDNAGRARSRGLELSGDVRPIGGLSLSGNLAYTQAELRSPAPDIGGSVGDALPYSPKWSGAISADYEHPLTESIAGFVGASWRYIGRRSSDFDTHIGQLRLPSYNTLDLRVGARMSHWSLEAFARNVTDRRGITSTSSVGLAPATGPNAGAGIAAGIIQPRSIGLTLGFNY